MRLHFSGSIDLTTMATIAIVLGYLVIVYLIGRYMYSAWCEIERNAYDTAWRRQQSMYHADFLEMGQCILSLCTQGQDGQGGTTVRLCKPALYQAEGGPILLASLPDLLGALTQFLHFRVPRHTNDLLYINSVNAHLQLLEYIACQYEAGILSLEKVENMCGYKARLFVSKTTVAKNSAGKPIEEVSCFVAMAMVQRMDGVIGLLEAMAIVNATDCANALRYAEERHPLLDATRQVTAGLS
jgi:hypothetical protein